MLALRQQATASDWAGREEFDDLAATIRDVAAHNISSS
jgi:hypothetical protein